MSFRVKSPAAVVHYAFAQKVPKTDRPAECDGVESFKRFVAFLQQTRLGVAERLGRESPRIHQHFGLTSSILDILDTNFSENRTVSFKSSFYDTPAFDLAHRNLWLVHQQGGWTLKYCTPATDENLVVFHVERDRVAIEQMLAEKLGLPSAKIETLFPTPYAEMDITRRSYISSPGCSLYVDVARLGPEDHYLVGTVCLPVEGAPSLDLLEAVTPVRSSVVEYLYHYNRPLYEELVKKKVLPALHAHYSKELTHHRYNPLDGPVKALFEGEEEQLLRSIGVAPGDEKAIGHYRDGADEAEMRWLPFLRLVHAVYLEGVEQGVYPPNVGP